MNKWGLAFALLIGAIAISNVASGARISDIRATPHNLSSTLTGTTPSGGTITPRTVQSKATSQGGTDQVCVFCHTPHGGSLKDQGGTDLGDANWRPALWNRKIPAGSSYTPYTSNSLDAATIQSGFNGQPGGSSKLCLSCHDGTIAVGSVNVWNGSSFNVTSEVIQMTGTAATDDKTMPGGTYGKTSGFTRNLGVNLTNDHPISVTYDEALANSDGELRTPDGNQRVAGNNLPTSINRAVGVRNSPSGNRPLLPLEKTGTAGAGQVQCATCHDPHIRDTTADHNIKFLRTNRFQVTNPASGTAGTFDANRDIICLACHNKTDTAAGTTWTYSAHAHPTVADEKYIESGSPSPASIRQFPTGRANGLRVWEAACLNCHDAHAVQGSSKLLREGTNATASGTAPATYRQGGSAAQENACYACHGTSSVVTAGVTTFAVANIERDFGYTYKMPIAASTENHDISSNFDDSLMGGTRANCSSTPNVNSPPCGKDLMERRTKLNSRHVECSDCHNPHRVIKNMCFNGNNNNDSATPPTASCTTGVGGPATPDTVTNSVGGATHNHSANHTNLASGVLSGTWGVEPTYSSDESFHLMPTGFEVKRGPAGSSTAVTSTYVTREYQVCLKCHSNYGYDDDNKPDVTSNRPAVSYAVACTSNASPPTTSASNCLEKYTNQSKEFRAPTDHTGNGSITDSKAYDSGAYASGAWSTSSTRNYQGYNHRSWHPVMGPTGRTAAIRGANASNWLAPWNTASSVGYQTMYCTDCHGSQNVRAGSVVPSDGYPWGPHGSNNRFILKNNWTQDSGEGDTDMICYRCHSSSNYGGTGGSTGFETDKGDGHSIHTNGLIDTKFRCRYCHVAVPHGWKNKALLVNLNDVGPEALCRQEDADDMPVGSKCTVGQPMPAGTEVRTAGAPTPGGLSWTDRGYTNPPYYLGAYLKIRRFRVSDAWNQADCGSSGQNGGNNRSGRDWMKDSPTEGCQNPN